jgi:hypothetical protein
MDPVVINENKLEQFKRTVEDAELLEEKNQLLQVILDCTSKNVYICLYTLQELKYKRWIL